MEVGNCAPMIIQPNYLGWTGKAPALDSLTMNRSYSRLELAGRRSYCSGAATQK